MLNLLRTHIFHHFGRKQRKNGKNDESNQVSHVVDFIVNDYHINLEDYERHRMHLLGNSKGLNFSIVYLSAADKNPSLQKVYTHSPKKTQKARVRDSLKSKIVGQPGKQ